MGEEKNPGETHPNVIQLLTNGQKKKKNANSQMESFSIQLTVFLSWPFIYKAKKMAKLINYFSIPL